MIPASFGDDEPGVDSAYYGGLDERFSDELRTQANVRKLLERMKGVSDRRAFYVCVAYLLIPTPRGLEGHIFEGKTWGIITHDPYGTAGFGFDSIFIPEGATRTFAEMTMHQKEGFSHRAKAFAQVKSFLKGDSA